MSHSSTFRQFTTQFFAIVKKDLIREARTKEVSITTIAFSILLLFIFVFSFFTSQNKSDLEEMALVADIFPGVLWVSIVFSATLAVSRTFAQEKDDGCLRALALIPGAASSLYASKLVLNLIFIFGFQIFLVPVIALVFDVSLADNLLPYIASVIAGSVGFAAIATIVAAMMVNSKMRDVMIPILVYPLIIPMLIGSLVITRNIYLGDVEAAWRYIRVLCAIDVLFVVICALLFRWVLEAIE